MLCSPMLLLLSLFALAAIATASIEQSVLSYAEKVEGLKNLATSRKLNAGLHHHSAPILETSSARNFTSLNITIFQPLALTLTPTKQYNLNQLSTVAMWAAGNHSQLLLLPELYLSGYNANLLDIASWAEPQFGPSYMTVSNICKTYNISILYTYPELDTSTGKNVYYDSAALIYRDGTTLTNYRKINVVPGIEDTYFGFSRGTEVSQVVELDGVQIGLAICFDSMFPEISRALAINSAQFILIPTANGYPPYVFNDVAQLIIPARASENSAAVAYINWIQEINSPFGEVLQFWGDSVVYQYIDGSSPSSVYTGPSNATDAPGTIAYVTLNFPIPYIGNSANEGRPAGNYMNNNLCQNINTVIEPVPGYNGPISVPSAPTMMPVAVASVQNNDDDNSTCVPVEGFIATLVILLFFLTVAIAIIVWQIVLPNCTGGKPTIGESKSSNNPMQSNNA